jgi:phosphoribosylanthranilate isomerase
MQYITKIKLNAINNLSDARYASAAGIHFGGFNFNTDHPRFITPIKAKEIIDWLSGIFIVGEFGNVSTQHINEVGYLLNLDAVEIIITPSTVTLEGIDFSAFARIKTSQFTSNQLAQTLAKLYPSVACFVIETNAYELQILQSILEPYMDKVFLDLDLKATEYTALCNAMKPEGVCLNAGDEEQPGIKDFDEIAEILDSLMVEEG